MVDTDQIKKLRDKTGISVMQCKKALEDANGDEEKALAFLRERGVEISEKKKTRTLGSGVIEAYVHAGSKVGVLLELLCETDFVARNEEFKALAEDISMHIAAMNPSSVSPDGDSSSVENNGGDATDDDSGPLLAQPFIKDPSLSVDDRLRQAIQKFGEKIEVGRFTRYALLE